LRFPDRRPAPARQSRAPRAASRRCAPSCRRPVQTGHCSTGIRARSDASGNRKVALAM